MARGELRKSDPMQAVQHFSGLCQSGMYQFAVLNLPEADCRNRMALTADEVEAAIDTFYRAWKPETQN